MQGDAPSTLRAAATVWHGFCNAWVTGPGVALAEVRPAIEVLRDGSDPQRLGDALLILGELLNRNGDIADDPQSCWPRRTRFSPPSMTAGGWRPTTCSPPGIWR